MLLSSLIRTHRTELGMTQTQVATAAGIALPTLQQVEAGKSNPSIGTIERIGRVLGFSVEYRARPCDWRLLTAWGVPLSEESASPSTPPSSTDHLLSELRRAAREAISSEDERRKTALSAFLLALHDHFPDVFRRGLARSEPARSLLNASLRTDRGKILKLRRIAVTRLSEYL